MPSCIFAPPRAVAAGRHTQYKREVHAGTLLDVTSELLTLGKWSVRFIHRMFVSETNDEVATTELAGVYFDVEARCCTPLPDLVRERAAELAVAGSGA